MTDRQRVLVYMMSSGEDMKWLEAGRMRIYTCHGARAQRCAFIASLSAPGEAQHGTPQLKKTMRTGRQLFTRLCGPAISTPRATQPRPATNRTRGTRTPNGTGVISGQNNVACCCSVHVSYAHHLPFPGKICTFNIFDIDRQLWKFFWSYHKWFIGSIVPILIKIAK
jgi:hypothetical protein